MSRFRVSFVLSGVLNTIIVDANDRYEALRLARATVEGTVIDVIAVNFDMKLFLADILGRQKISSEKLTLAVVQISTMTGAGISLMSALQSVIASGSGELASVFGRIISEINAGSGFGVAVERNSQKLGREFVSMAKLGEQTGDMASAMNELSRMLEKKSRIIEKLQRATIYPLLTLASAVAAFVVIMVVVVPKFEAIFDKFHLKLPFFTTLLLGTERFLVDFGTVLFCSLLAFLMLFISFYRHNVEFQYKIDKMVLRLPFFGDLICFGVVNNFSMVLARLTAAGIPIIQALHIALENILNKYLYAQIQNSLEHIEQGGGLGDALDSAKIYDTLAMGLISAGEQSGEMVAMFEKVAEYYERRFDAKVEMVSVMIEPMMILFVGMMVFALALGIFVPLWDMSGAIRAR